MVNTLNQSWCCLISLALTLILIFNLIIVNLIIIIITVFTVSVILIILVTLFITVFTVSIFRIILVVIIVISLCSLLFYYSPCYSCNVKNQSGLLSAKERMYHLPTEPIPSVLCCPRRKLTCAS